MRHWYAYTGNGLMAGHGRSIRCVMQDTYALQRIFETAQEHYTAYAATPHRRMPAAPAKDFIAAMAAPLAIREFGADVPPATVFSSAAQVLRLFDGLDIEQVAINIFNSRITSEYASDDGEGMAQRVIAGFEDGELLSLPRDALRLQAKETLDRLPGAVVFLLSRAKAEQKAFAQYLRRGAPPVVPADAMAIIARVRPVLPTFEREARLKREGAPA